LEAFGVITKDVFVQVLSGDQEEGNDVDGTLGASASDEALPGGFILRAFEAAEQDVGARVAEPTLEGLQVGVVSRLGCMAVGHHEDRTILGHVIQQVASDARDGAGVG